ncbi:MAG: Cys-tRNA(Pro) deacylase [Sphaerochaetaceae bacterium]
MKKTNAMRILENLKIEYSTISYEVDFEHLDAVTASKEAGLNPEQVYKTIVMTNGNRDNFVFCLPSFLEINLKIAKQLTNSKNIELLKLDKLLSITGYIRGGCSPLGMKKKFPTFIEELSIIEPFIFVSAGLRGLQLKIRPEDLVKACNAELVSFTL